MSAQHSTQQYCSEKEQPIQHAIIRSHGATTGDTGPAGIAYTMIDRDDRETRLTSNTVTLSTGVVSPVQASYLALQHALEAALRAGVPRVTIHIASNDVVDQLHGDTQCSEPGVHPYNQTVVDLLNRFDETTVKHASTEDNTDVIRRSTNAAPTPDSEA